jgi:aminopeptidase N
LNFDFLLPVTGATVDGERAAVSRPDPHEVKVTPADPLPAGRRVRVRLRLRYDGFPSRYSSVGESNWLANNREVVTMNKPHMAPWWFPSNDHPQDKARFDIHIKVANGNRVIANGKPTGVTRGESSSTWHWRAREPMAPYLAYFAAGDFQVEEGTTEGRHWLIAVSRGLDRRTRRHDLRLLRRSPEVVAWLESEYGPYPFNTTGGLSISLPVGFALENQTRPTYSGVNLGTMVHELAHQWFGDDVSVRRRRDIWLNEGFASYVQFRYGETHGGPSVARVLRGAYDEREAGDRFWKLQINDPGPKRLFDGAIYSRGAMTLAALRNRIGDRDFSTLLRRWTAENSRSDATTAEFRALAADVSGEDLDGLFDAWLVATEKPADTAENGLG